MYVGSYVDDNLTLGTEENIKEMIEGINQQGLTVTLEEELEDYLSCRIIFDEGKKKAWLGQPHLIKKLIKKFGKKVKKMHNYEVPGTPGFGIRKV